MEHFFDTGLLKVGLDLCTLCFVTLRI